MIFGLLTYVNQVSAKEVKIKVEDFHLSGSADIIITESEMTILLWQNLEEADDRFSLFFNEDEVSKDSMDFYISGECEFEGTNFFVLDWTISRADRPSEKAFAFQGKGLSEVRSRLYQSLDSMLAPLQITTNSDSATIILDDNVVGKSPVSLTNVPVGWHNIKAEGVDGVSITDSLHLTRDSTTFHFPLHVTQQIYPSDSMSGVGDYKSKSAYIRLLSPPKCDLYVNGNHLSATFNQIYSVEPGELDIHLVSRQYGMRNQILLVAPGDTVTVGFFSQNK